MELPPENEFNDHALKGAVRRCWADECAPPELRQKLARIAGDISPQTGSAVRSRRIMWMALSALPIAAAILLSFVFFARSKPAAPVVAVAALPVSLQTDLIVRHDVCCQEKDHQHLAAPRNDDAAIAAALHTQLGRAVLVAHPADPAWTFRGASICPVGSVPAGHLVFVKGDNALSLFSLPKSVTPQAADGDTFSSTINQHSIVGFVKNGALFCLVGSGPPGTVDVKQLDQFRRDMEPSVSLTNVHSPSQIVLAELLHPIAP